MASLAQQANLQLHSIASLFIYFQKRLIEFSITFQCFSSYSIFYKIYCYLLVNKTVNFHNTHFYIQIFRLIQSKHTRTHTHFLIFPVVFLSIFMDLCICVFWRCAWRLPLTLDLLFKKRRRKYEHRTALSLNRIRETTFPPFVTMRLFYVRNNTISTINH